MKHRCVNCAYYAEEKRQDHEWCLRDHIDDEDDFAPDQVWCGEWTSRKHLPVIAIGWALSELRYILPFAKSKHVSGHIEKAIAELERGLRK